MKKKILIVEDEKKIVDVVRAYLERENYNVFAAGTGGDAFDIYEKEKPDLIILDLMLPDIKGEDLCKKIRLQSDIPILILTAKSQEEDKIEGFYLGADDYLTKPFSPKELVARVRALVRRSKAQTETLVDRLDFGELSIDTVRHKVTKKGIQINLTLTEYNILLALARHPGKVYSRSSLIEKIRSCDCDVYDRIIDAHIKNLRKKIEEDFASPVYIKTIYGIGYQFKAS